MNNHRPWSLLMVILIVLAPAAYAQSIEILSHGAAIAAPVDEVWTAFTTKPGLESWMVAHAEIDLKVGGKMKTHYQPDGVIGDNRTIENTILSYEPRRMLSIRVSMAPEGFPFPEAIKSMWTVIYFDSIDEKSTAVRVVSMGFGGDPESLKMRAFFDRGNAFTLQGLQKRFAPLADRK